MKKFLLSIFLLSWLALVFEFSWVSVGAGQSIVVRVPADYPTIQYAINASDPGSIILVSSGIYYERLLVNKSLTIIGQNKASTILDGGGKGTVITVRADGILIDGFTVRNGDSGIDLIQSSNSTIKGNIITLHGNNGIAIDNSAGNNILDNIISQCGTYIPGYGSWGVLLVLADSSENVVSSNILTNAINYVLFLGYSSRNQIYRNTIANNEVIGVPSFPLVYSHENAIHHNNFVNTTGSIVLQKAYNNTWDDGHEGNYWDDYYGLDDGSGGRVAGDGVGDTNLPHNFVDNYPLVNPVNPIPIVWENIAYPVYMSSNSTILAIRFGQVDQTIQFYVSVPAETSGYFNITIPKSLMIGDPWTILLNNNTEATSQAVIRENQTHTSIYLTYNQNTYNVQIIATWVVPEFPTTIVSPLLMVLTLLAAILAKKAHRTSDRPQPRKISKSL